MLPRAPAFRPAGEKFDQSSPNHRQPGQAERLGAVLDTRTKMVDDILINCKIHAKRVGVWDPDEAPCS
jgi:hypothetical protein